MQKKNCYRNLYCCGCEWNETFKIDELVPFIPRYNQQSLKGISQIIVDFFLYSYQLIDMNWNNRIIIASDVNDLMTIPIVCTIATTTKLPYKAMYFHRELKWYQNVPKKTKLFFTKLWIHCIIIAEDIGQKPRHFPMNQKKNKTNEENRRKENNYNF